MTDEDLQCPVKFLRLNNGDDIVAQIVEIEDNQQIDYMVINPLKVVYVPSSRGVSYLQVAFAPWVFSGISKSQEFLIHADDVITISDASEKMNDYYWNNIDHFFSEKEEDAISSGDQSGEDNLDETDLESILQAITSGKRTFH